jgi:hypothetical protein
MRSSLSQRLMERQAGVDLSNVTGSPERTRCLIDARASKASEFVLDEMGWRWRLFGKRLKRLVVIEVEQWNQVRKDPG